MGFAGKFSLSHALSIVFESLVQLLMIAVGLMATMVLGYVALSGQSPAKEASRRLQAVRYRHSESAMTRVEAQMRKAAAARKPRAHRVAGSDSKIEALHLRLRRSGKNWTLTQYVYASAGLAVTVAAVIYLKSGAPLLALGVGLFVGAGLPHFVVGYFINKRSGAFTSKFPASPTKGPQAARS